MSNKEQQLYKDILLRRPSSIGDFINKNCWLRKRESASFVKAALFIKQTKLSHNNIKYKFFVWGRYVVDIVLLCLINEIKRVKKSAT